MKQFWAFAVIPGVILTLATWLFFKYAAATSAAPLNVGETSVVFGGWLLLLWIVRSIWRRFSKKPAGDSPHEKPES